MGHISVLIHQVKNIDARDWDSEYQLSKALPKELKASLPTVEEIEAELNEVMDERE